MVDWKKFLSENEKHLVVSKTEDFLDPVVPQMSRSGVVNPGTLFKPHKMLHQGD